MLAFGTRCPNPAPMSDRPAPFPDPPVPGTTVWRGWLTKKGSFIPSLKRRFGTLQIGRDYAVTLDYREDATSSSPKGVFTFTSATKCIENSSSIGSIPVQQCLILQIDPPSGAKVYCGFDTVEARQLFQAAVEWAVNAKSHVAAFQSKQERAKQILQEDDSKRVQEELQRARQEPGRQPCGSQQDLSGQQASVARTLKSAVVEDQELISRLIFEVTEYHNTIQGLTVQSQHSSVLTVDSSLTATTFNRPFSQDSVSRLTSVGGQISTDFVLAMALEQEAHSIQLELAAKSAVRILS